MMSHNYDVSNSHFKRGTQKQQGTINSRLVVDHLIPSNGKLAFLKSLFLTCSIFPHKTIGRSGNCPYVSMLKSYGQFSDLLIVFCEKREHVRTRNSITKVSQHSESGGPQRVLSPSFGVSIDDVIVMTHQKNCRKINFRCESLYATSGNIIDSIVSISWSITKTCKFGPENA